MTLRPRRGLWHFRFKCGGKEISGSTGLAATPENRPQAHVIEEWNRIVTVEGRMPQVGKLLPCGFREAVDGFLAWDGKRRPAPATLKRLRASFSKAGEFFKDTPLATIDKAGLKRYKDWRKQKHGVKESTLRHDLQALSMLFKYSFRRRWVGSNPTGKPLFPLNRRDPAATVPQRNVRTRRGPAKLPRGLKVPEATLRSVPRQPRKGGPELHTALAPQLQKTAAPASQVSKPSSHAKAPATGHRIRSSRSDQELAAASGHSKSVAPLPEAALKASPLQEAAAESRPIETRSISEPPDPKTRAIERLADQVVTIIVSLIRSETDALAPQLRTRTLQRIFLGARSFKGVPLIPWTAHPRAEIDMGKLMHATQPDADRDFPPQAFVTQWVVNILAALVPDRSRWKDVLDEAEPHLLMPEQRLK